MFKYENMPIGTVREKYALARLNKSQLITDLIWGFIVMFIMGLLMWADIGSGGWFQGVVYYGLAYGVLCCGIIHSFKRLSFIGGGVISLIFKLFIALLITFFLTPFDIVKTIIELKQLKPIIEKDREMHPELYLQN